MSKADEEEWRDIIGYEGEYQVSSFGNIKSIKNNIILKPIIGTKNNYKYVNLYKNGKPKVSLVHRLVAKAFIPNPNNKEQVNHIDGNKHNNNINNLEWLTPKENVNHAFDIGLVKNTKKVNQYDLNGNFIKTWNRINDIQKELGFFTGHICLCCQHRLNKSHGFIWRYANDKL